MNKTLLLHSIWAVIAIIAFVVGIKGGVNSDSASDESEDQRGSRLYQRSSGADAASSRTRSATRTSQISGARSTDQSRRVRLSENAIQSLGNVLRTSTDPIERRIAFAKLLEGLTVENAATLREQIVHMSSNSSEWKDFHYAWGALGGQSVVEFGETSEKTDMAAAFSGWASANPQAALNWYNSKDPSHQNRKDFKWATVYGLTNADPQLATNFAMQRHEVGDKDADNMVNFIAKTILKSGTPSEAARWSASLPEGKLQDAAVSQVARDYARADPLKAVAWLESLPEGNGQNKGLWVAFSNWASRDADAAVNHLNRMGNSPARDSAVTGYARQVVYQNPHSALDWAATIADPKMRTDTLIRSGRIYAKRDRDGAQQWLARSNLPLDIQQRIIGSKKKK